MVVGVVVLLALAAAGWYGYIKFLVKQPQNSAAPQVVVPATAGAPSKKPEAPSSKSAPAPRATKVPSAAQAPKTDQAQRQPTPTQRPAGGGTPLTPPPPVSPPPVPARASTGVLVWTGSLDKHTIVIIDGRSASIGSLQGELPGIPVLIEIEPDGVGVAVAPSPSNGWKRIVLSCRKGTINRVTIRWHAL